MSTLDKDFTSFIADRTGKLDNSYRPILNLLKDLPKETQEKFSRIESLATERAYRIGFLDGLSIVFGLDGR